MATTSFWAVVNLAGASPRSQDAHQPDMKTQATVHPVDQYLPFPLPPPPLKCSETAGSRGGPPPSQLGETGPPTREHGQAWLTP